MKPLNTAERKKTFINFLIFFIVTTAVMLAAVIFSFQVPIKENEQLRSSVAKAQNQAYFTNMFSDKISATMKLLDSVNMSEMQSQSGRFEAGIEVNLKDMNEMVLRDSASDKNLYQNVTNSLALLQHAKKQIRDASGKDQSLDNLNKEIDDLNRKLMQANLEIQAFRSNTPQH